MKHDLALGWMCVDYVCVGFVQSIAHPPPTAHSDEPGLHIGRLCGSEDRQLKGAVPCALSRRSSARKPTRPPPPADPGAWLPPNETPQYEMAHDTPQGKKCC